MRRLVVLALVLAGCDKLLGLSDVTYTPDAADAAVERITGDYRYLVAAVGSDGLPVQQDLPSPPDTELVAMLPDGTSVPIDRASDGSFAFTLPPGSSYRFAVRDSDQSVATEYQSASPTLALRRYFFSRLDAQLPTMPTAVDVQESTTVTDFAQVGGLGIRGWFMQVNFSMFTFDWSSLGIGLFSAAKNDRFVYTNWTHSTIAPWYYTISEADVASVEMVDGQPVTIGPHTPTPVAQDRCVHLTTHGKTELGRLGAATGLDVSDSSVSGAGWDLFSTPIASMGPDGGLPLVENSTNVAADDDRDITYGTPYVGESDVSVVQIYIERPLVLPQTNGTIVEHRENFYDLIQPGSGSPCSSVIDATATPIAQLATTMLAQTSLDKDGQAITIDRSAPVRLEYTLGSGAVDNVSVELDEAISVAPGGQPSTVVVPLRTYIVRDGVVVIDPELFVRGHYYLFNVTTRTGLPGAAQLDFRAQTFPQGFATIYTTMFRIAN
jgi:hypothetical protein